MQGCNNNEILKLHSVVVPWLHMSSRMERRIVAGSGEIQEQLPWKAGVILCWSWVNISLSGDTARWFPQGKTHPQQEKACEFHGWALRSLEPWDLMEERGRNAFLCRRIQSIQRPEMERRPLWEGLAMNKEIQWRGSGVISRVEVNSWRARSDERRSGRD